MRVSCNFLTSGEAASGPVAARGWDGPTGAALMENILDPLRAPPLGLLTPDQPGSNLRGVGKAFRTGDF